MHISLQCTSEEDIAVSKGSRRSIEVTIVAIVAILTCIGTTPVAVRLTNKGWSTILWCTNQIRLTSYQLGLSLVVTRCNLCHLYQIYLTTALVIDIDTIDGIGCDGGRQQHGIRHHER